MEDSTHNRLALLTKKDHIAELAVGGYSREQIAEMVYEGKASSDNLKYIDKCIQDAMVQAKSIFVDHGSDLLYLDYMRLEQAIRGVMRIILENEHDSKAYANLVRLIKQKMELVKVTTPSKASPKNNDEYAGNPNNVFTTGSALYAEAVSAMQSNPDEYAKVAAMPELVDKIEQAQQELMNETDDD